MKKMKRSDILHLNYFINVIPLSRILKENVKNFYWKLHFISNTDSCAHDVPNYHSLFKKKLEKQEYYFCYTFHIQDRTCLLYSYDVETIITWKSRNIQRFWLLFFFFFFFFWGGGGGGGQRNL